MVLAVRAEGLHVVVKQALPRLRVADEWLAKRERAVAEAAALRLAGELAPGAVPRVLDVDEEECALVVEHAPVGWQNWKELLLAGHADPAVARRLGHLLAIWQEGTSGDIELDGADVFEQLRVDPYHRTVMRRAPELSAAVGAYVERMLATRLCLVHGDYSPKNVLAGDDGLWVIDFEVAHLGDPAFDVAFMLNHLLLKAIHRPGSASAYEECSHAFVSAYRTLVPTMLAPEPRYVLGQVGCLMVARVDGKSPAEYLGEEERGAARRFGQELLLDPPETLEQVWALLPERAAG